MEKMRNEDLRKENLKRILCLKRDEIIKNSKVSMKKILNGEDKQTFGAGMEEGDMSNFFYSQDISYTQLNAQHETIRKIEAALKRLEEGEYGVCEECGEEIGEARLKAVPFALYCRDCQELKEMRKLSEA